MSDDTNAAPITLEVFPFCRDELLPQFTNPSAPVSAKKLCALLDVVLSSAIHLSLQTDRELKHRIVALEQEIAALKAQPKGLNFCGVWESGHVYEKDAGVTFQGALWIARDRTAARPGVPGSLWTLAAKGDRAHRNGKDAQHDG